LTASQLKIYNFLLIYSVCVCVCVCVYARACVRAYDGDGTYFIFVLVKKYTENILIIFNQSRRISLSK